MSDQEEPDDVMDLDIRTDDPERKWLVLFDEDYENVMIDGQDQVALLVDIEQAGEIVRLATMAIASISARADADDEVLRTLIEQLEQQVDDDE